MNAKGEQQRPPPSGWGETERRIQAVAAQNGEDPGRRGVQLVMHAGLPEVRLGFCVRRRPSGHVPLTLVRDLGTLGERPEETHHLTGGQKLRARRQRRRERDKRGDQGSPISTPLPGPSDFGVERWKPQRVSAVCARKCPRLPQPHPHPKEAEGFLLP